MEKEKLENTDVETEVKEEVEKEESEMAFGITDDEFQEIEEIKDGE